jgi:ComF family protein
MEAIADPPAYGRARAAVRYDDVAATLVHALKYGDRLDLAPMMGRWMAIAGRELLASADALVPVPLHWRRQWARRFNQSALLAEIVATASGRKVVHQALKRVKATAQQVGLDKSARAQNVQGAFRVPEAGRAEVIGRKLVLVDDVLTSGATIDVCARTLLRAGAASVDVLVFARVVAGGRKPI